MTIRLSLAAAEGGAGGAGAAGGGLYNATAEDAATEAGLVDREHAHTTAH